MKRHPSLVHLSREHHGALILARLLQKGAPAYKSLPTGTEGKALYALKFYQENLVKHFEEEEKALKIVTGVHPALDLLVSAIFREHQALHQSFKSLNPHVASTEYLDELGAALEIHIRKEERELFPLIEETCGEALLTAIDKSLSSNL